MGTQLRSISMYSEEIGVVGAVRGGNVYVRYPGTNVSPFNFGDTDSCLSTYSLYFVTADTNFQYQYLSTVLGTSSPPVTLSLRLSLSLSNHSSSFVILSLSLSLLSLSTHSSSPVILSLSNLLFLAVVIGIRSDHQN